MKMLQRPLRLTEANWANWELPCDIVEDYQSIIEALCKAVNLAAMSMELVMRIGNLPYDPEKMIKREGFS